MHSHVKLLAILHILFAGCSLLIGLAILVVFGGVAGLVGMVSPPEGARIAVPILGVVGIFIFAIMAALSIPGLVCGFGLLGHRRWARTLTIVLSAFEILNVPFGTLLGIYGLWVLTSAGADTLFADPSTMVRT